MKTKILFGCGALAIAGAIGAMGGHTASAISLSDYLVINPEYEKYINDVNSGEGDKWGVVPLKYVPNTVTTYQSLKTDRGGEDLPNRYMLSDDGITMTQKNQGADGDCWAFATTTVLESKLKKSGINYEFSPKQMDYMLAKSGPYGEVMVSEWGASFARELGDGGNFAMASLLLGGSHAPVSESSFFSLMQRNDSALAGFTDWNDYNDIASILYNVTTPYQVAISNAQLMSLTPKYVVTDYRGYLGSSDSVTTIKEDLQRNGAVYVSTWFPMTPNTSGLCWDAAKKTIIDKGSACESTSGAHALTIIGWDDNYTYTDNGTTKTGAFRLQNSYGAADKYDVDELISRGFLRNNLTAAERAEVEAFFADLDLYDEIWLGYDFVVSEASRTINFATISNIEQDNYEKVYDILDVKNGIVTADAKAIEHTYTADEEGMVEAIAVGLKNAIAPFDMTLTVYIGDGSGSYEKVGDLAFEALDYGQKKIELGKAKAVDGDFVIKIVGEAGGEAVTFADDMAFALTTTVYTEEETVEVPSTGVPEEPGEDPAGDEPAGGDGTVSKAPVTGWFTGSELGAKLVGVLMLVITLAGAGFGVYTYRERKHLFHKIGFEKKR